jgi:hypothetical protein
MVQADPFGHYQKGRQAKAQEERQRLQDQMTMQAHELQKQRLDAQMRKDEAAARAAPQERYRAMAGDLQAKFANVMRVDPANRAAAFEGFRGYVGQAWGPEAAAQVAKTWEEELPDYQALMEKQGGLEFAKPSVKDYTPESVKAAQATGDITKLRARNKPGDKPAERERKIASYINHLGMTRAEAIKYADGLVEVSEPLPDGTIRITDLVGGQTRIARGSDRAGAVADEAAAVVGDEKFKGMNIDRVAKEASGPVAAVAQMLSDTIGFIVPGRVGAASVDSKQAMRIFNKYIMASFKNSGSKFPVWEQKTIQNLLLDPDKWLGDPDDAVAKMGSIRAYLKDSIALARQQINTTRNPGKRADLADQIELMAGHLDMMGAPLGGMDKKSEDRFEEIKRRNQERRGRN